MHLTQSVTEPLAVLHVVCDCDWLCAIVFIVHENLLVLLRYVETPRPCNYYALLIFLPKLRTHLILTLPRYEGLYHWKHL